MTAVPLPLLGWLAILLAGWGPNTRQAVVRAGRAPAIAHHVTATASRPRFVFDASPLTHAQRTRVAAASWHPGCPVGLSGLRHLRISYWGFGYRPHVGEMVVNASTVKPLHRAFAALFAAKFPIRRMRLVDDYGGSDYASIAADNTSAFNCRNVTGGSGWSMHAYGLAVDINPIENPYVYANETTAHAASKTYLDRGNAREGMAIPHGALVRSFDAIGWGWGGRWPGPTDYQHFSANGR